MKKRTAQRTEEFDSSVFRNIFMHQQMLKDPIDLSVGSPEDATHDKIKSAGIKAIQNDQTGYTPANGISVLRHTIANKIYKQNNIMLPANQITVVPGLTTGLLLVYMAILDPGDEIITIDPGYPPYEQLATAMGAVVMSIPATANFQLDLQVIEATITSKTKAIVINSPNNPTGAVYPEADLRKLAEIADKNDIYIISDEIYEHFVYEGKHFSIGSIYPDTISMFGFSKQFSMTGWRLGYMTGPYDVIEAVNELQQYSVFSSSSIAQHAAVEAMALKINLVPKYKKKRDIVVSSLEKAGVEVHGAHGSYYVFFKAPGKFTDLDFAEKLLDHSLVLVPGRAFSGKHNYMRLSYGAPLATVKKGIEELIKVINMVK